MVAKSLLTMFLVELEERKPLQEKVLNKTKLQRALKRTETEKQR